MQPLPIFAYNHNQKILSFPKGGVYKLSRARIAKKKKKKDTSPMPATGAGLMRFYEEDSPGIRVGPRTVVILGVFLIITVILAQLAAAGRGPFGG